MQTAASMHHRFKMALVGDAKVGKSAFINTLNGEQPRKYQQSRGVELYSENVELSAIPLRATLWDISSQEFASPELPIHLRDSDAVMIFLDSTRPLAENQEYLKHWHRTAKALCPNAKIYITLSKSDLNPQQTSSPELQRFCKNRPITIKTANVTDQQQCADLLRGVLNYFIEIPAVLAQIEVKARSISFFAKPSSKQVALDIAEECGQEEPANPIRIFEYLSVYFSRPTDDPSDEFSEDLMPRYQNLLQLLIVHFPQAIVDCIARGNFPADPKICVLLPQVLKDQLKRIDIQESPSSEFELVHDEHERLLIRLRKALINCLYTSSFIYHKDNARRTAQAIIGEYGLQSPGTGKDIRRCLLSYETTIYAALSKIKTPQELLPHLRKLFDDKPLVQSPTKFSPSALKNTLKALLFECEQLGTGILEATRSLELTIPSAEECVGEIHRVATSSTKTIAKDLLKLQNSEYILQILSFYFSHFVDAEHPDEFSIQVYTPFLQLMGSLIRNEPYTIRLMIQEKLFPTVPNVCCVLPNRYEKPHPLKMLESYGTDAGDMQHARRAYTELLQTLHRGPAIAPNSPAERVSKTLAESLYHYSLGCDFAENRPQDRAVIKARRLIQMIFEIIDPQLECLPDNFSGESIRRNLCQTEHLILARCILLDEKRELSKKMKLFCESVEKDDSELAATLRNSVLIESFEMQHLK